METSTRPKYPSEELLECPYPFFDQARSGDPVYRDEENGVYLVFSHEAIHHAMRNNKTFVGINGAISYRGVPMISAVEPPEHTPMRHLAYRPFTPGRLRSYRPLVHDYADQLIDAFEDRGTVELVEDFALILPALVICRLMGLPTEGEEFATILDRTSMRTVGRRSKAEEDALVYRDPDNPIPATGKEPTKIELTQEYMREAIEARFRQPTDDILSELVKLQVDRDGEFDMPYLVTIATELLIGGVITTAQMIVNAAHLLVTHPDQLEMARTDPKLIAKLLEESLRLESPVQSQPRLVTEDTELGGVKIPKGSQVLLVFASGNRDEARFENADRFDICRPHSELKGHFGFGFGVHFCLGAPLARMEGEVAFDRILTRLKNIRMADEQAAVEHIPSLHFRAVKELNLTFERA